MDDIKRLLYLKLSGVVGVIIGRALYSGAINLREAIEFVKISCQPTFTKN
jgi:phosphoribosylformimino-5-aminoimidazole carboxamide ribotide isomerase